MDNYINKEQFFVQSKVFFEEGILKEIYSSDNIIICNVANAFYMIFNYTITKSGPIGVFLEPKYIEALIENDSLFNELYNVMGRKKFEQSCRFLNKEAYEYLKGVKQKTDLNGAYVDLDWEKSITSGLSKR